MIALPLFGIGTGIWAGKQQKKTGEINRELGRRHAWHWTVIPIFLVLANALFIGAPFDGDKVGQVVLLVVGLVYYLGGVYFWRGYWFGGLAIASGMFWLLILESYPWTLTGLLTFIALLVPAALDWRRHVRIQD
ncbi:MAG: hypothetical protein HYV26_07070 [Candidatus Hydrogenedentes bacterium]|nr:hypothetical protein [Candidatus Hydrogenedentota bacterium]